MVNIQLEKAIEEIICQLAKKPFLSNKIKQIDKQISVDSDFCVIDWLASQKLYPKFYWQSRNQQQEVAALGQKKIINNITDIENNLANGERIYGGRGFSEQNKKNQFFFIPEIELLRFEKKWHLKVNLDKKNNQTIKNLRSLNIKSINEKSFKSKIAKIENIPDKHQWNQLVDKAILAISHDQLKKIVLARISTIQLSSNINAAKLLKKSISENNSSYHYMLEQNEDESFIGSSPERLFKKNGKSIQTEALAGTSKRGQDAIEDIDLGNWLIKDNKNLAELQIVVDDITEHLAKYVDEIKIEKQARIIKLRKVQHLIRKISAKLFDNLTCSQLLKLLHPTAAVAGFPRSAARKFIKNSEQFNRDWYSGYLGIISKQYSEFCVAIRCAKVKKNILSIYAGAGIVAGSNPELEWQELDNKSSTILSLINQ